MQIILAVIIVFALWELFINWPYIYGAVFGREKEEHDENSYH